MKIVLLVFAVLLCCISWTAAAPAPAPAGDEKHNVQFVNYKNQQDFEAIMRQIIAQYDHLGGSSQFHEVQSAGVVDPQHIRINI